MRAIRLLVLTLCAFSAISLQTSAESAGVAAPRTLRIAAASNFTGALDELVKAYSAEKSELKIEISYGATGALAAQILSGAPFSLFLSADAETADKVAAAGLGASSPFTFAKGALALFVKRGFGPTKGLLLLLDASIKSIAIANPETAPYGRAAIECMKSAGVYESVKAKLVFAQSIAQAAQSGLVAADAAFIARSALHTKDFASYPEDGPSVYLCDPKSYSPLAHIALALKTPGTGQGTYATAEEAIVFAAWLLGERAQSILARYGYSPR